MCQGSKDPTNYYFSNTNIDIITDHLRVFDFCVSCNLVLYENETYTGTSTITECSVKLKNVTVQSGYLTIDVENSVLIEGNFQVNEDNSFEISK